MYVVLIAATRLKGPPRAWISPQSSHTLSDTILTLQLALSSHPRSKKQNRKNSPKTLPSISPTLLKPPTHIKISKSANSPFITCLTPASPIILNPHTHSRPTHTNFAPSANAFATSLAPRMPESYMIYVFSPTAATMFSSASRLAIAPSTCRPAWLLTTMPSQPI